MTTISFVGRGRRDNYFYCDYWYSFHKHCTVPRLFMGGKQVIDVVFKARGKITVFDGFLKAYQEETEEKSRDESDTIDGEGANVLSIFFLFFVLFVLFYFVSFSLIFFCRNEPVSMRPIVLLFRF